MKSTSVLRNFMVAVHAAVGIGIFWIISTTEVIPLGNSEGFFDRLAMLFTFSTLIIGLFGIGLFFQSTEAYEKLIRVECELSNHMEDIMEMRVLSRLSRHLGSVNMLRDPGFLRAQYYLSVVARGHGAYAEEEYNLHTVFLELGKLSGGKLLDNVLIELSAPSPYRKRYENVYEIGCDIRRQIVTTRNE